MSINSPGEQKERSGRRITWIGLLANILLTVVKLIGGWLGRSQALIADAIHSLSDLFSDFIVLWGLRMRGKAPDANHHFGHGRVETMAAAIVGLILAGASAVLFYDSWLDITGPPQPQPTAIALLVALVSIVVKEVLYRMTMNIGKRIKSASVQANAWHHRSDALSSVAVLLGVAVAMVWPGAHWADGAATMVVAAMILWAGFMTVWKSMRELSDAAPPPEVIGSIKHCVLTVPGVKNFHDLKVRTSGGLIQAQIHVAVPKDLTVAEGHAIAKTVELCLLRDVEGLDQVIVHIDPV